MSVLSQSTPPHSGIAQIFQCTFENNANGRISVLSSNMPRYYGLPYTTFSFQANFHQDFFIFYFLFSSEVLLHRFRSCSECHDEPFDTYNEKFYPTLSIDCDLMMEKANSSLRQISHPYTILFACS